MRKRYVPRTGIICTLGPASSKETVLRRMMSAGMDVARINFSHGTLSEHEKRIDILRELNRRYRRKIRVLGDLEGPRIRLGYFAGGESIPLSRKKIYLFVREAEYRNNPSGNRIPLDYRDSFLDMEGASHIYADDGNIVFRIKQIEPDRIRAAVQVDGIMKQRKGINVPGANLSFPPFTDRDRRNIEFAVLRKFDYIALSFVRNPDDMVNLRRMVQKNSTVCELIAKIENRESIQCIDAVIDVSDGVMIARGDMGISVPIYTVPLIQKSIIAKCREKGKFVITATQMLEHMVEYPTPTRAEVTDIANAVIDGTNYVMLSAETAVGRHPVTAVRTMNEVIRYTELHHREFPLAIDTTLEESD
jgi:pyruvate kinase